MKKKWKKTKRIIMEDNKKFRIEDDQKLKIGDDQKSKWKTTKTIQNGRGPKQFKIHF